MGRGQGGGGGGGARLAGGGTIRTAGGVRGAALTDQERASIFNYSNITYDAINKQLRAGGPISETLQQTLDNIDKGLEKLPNYRGQTYRVLTFDTPEEVAAFTSQFKAGGTAKFREYLSTSRVKTAESFEFESHTFSTNVRFTIKGKSGKNITRYANQPGQQEVLFGRGAKFKVTSVTKHEGARGGRYGERQLYSTDITLEEL